MLVDCCIIVVTIILLHCTLYMHDAVPMDLDVKMKAVMLGATFLIVSIP